MRMTEARRLLDLYRRAFSDATEAEARAEADRACAPEERAPLRTAPAASTTFCVPRTLVASNSAHAPVAAARAAKWTTASAPAMAAARDPLSSIAPRCSVTGRPLGRR